jgi:hypothetical protein
MDSHYSALVERFPLLGLVNNYGFGPTVEKDLVFYIKESINAN